YLLDPVAYRAVRTWEERELLGVDPADVDLTVPADELGLDHTGRRRLLERLGSPLPVEDFPARTTLAALAVRTAAAEPAEATTPAPAGDDLLRRAEGYLVRLLAEESRLPVERIRTRAPLQEYGIESVLIARLNQRLEDAFGGLSSTLFFEYQTIAEVAGYLTRERPERVAALTGAPLATVAREPAPAERPAPAGPVRGTGDIAVIGMAGRYPMAADNDEFWQNLLAGRDCIVEVPADRWDHARYLSDDPEEPGTTYARWGGFIDDVDKFDARFFQIAPKEAEGMDPQQRLFLESAWAALEDAGYTPARVRETARRRGTKDAGVFAGVTYGEYQLLVDLPAAGYWAVPNRVSYHLGFNGPSLAVDTACSASMTAVHLAVESLRRGECGYAIAGGVNVSIHPGKFVLLGYGRWASSDGRCRAFGAGGDGYVPGEGVVSLVLKPLADAEADGDRVYAVIRGSSVNHGARTNGFTVPNPNAQADLVHEALVQAGVDARAVSYVEAHGTGTSLGDPIEVTALTNAYRRFTPEHGYCAIGSAKASIGHLEAAAGAAGIVKTVLQLRHETIAPSPHADPPNPNIDFARSPFVVAAKSVPWPHVPGGSPRIAAVSSFGAGGANGHVVLQEYPPAPPVAPAGGPRLVLLSARRPERLAEQARNLLAFLRGPAGAAVTLEDVAWTLMRGREPFEHRLAVVAGSVEELAGQLAGHLAGARVPGAAHGHVPAYSDRADGTAPSDVDHLRRLYAGGQWLRLAELWTQGWAIDWPALAGQPAGRIVSLPTYPFARDRHWVVPAEYRRTALPAADEPAPEPEGTPALAGAPEPDDFRASVLRTVTEVFAELTKVSPDELDPDADFMDFGFDSVTSVRMLNRLMKIYDVQLAGSLIVEYTTIGSLTDHLVGEGLLVGAGGEGALPEVLTAPAREVEPLVLDAPLPVESVFLTGVTGVLGGRLLYDLLAGTTATVSCLVRADDEDEAMRRIARLLAVYDREGALTGELHKRVTPLLGDVTREHLGLDPAHYEAVAARTDLTIHAAARTVLVTFYDALAPINVEGTRRMIDFALRTPHKHLAYVSSFSALGDWLLENNRPFTEHDLELGQEYDHLPYQQTKYHAEKLIRAATDEGLVWNIFRPGNIMGDARTGRYPFAEVTVKGAYYDIFKTVAETGIAAMTPNHWDITPVDYVAAGLLHLAMRRGTYRETYHLTNPDIQSLYDVFTYVRAYGYPMRPVTIEEYHRLAVQRLFRTPGSDEPYDSQTVEMIKYGIETWGPEHYARSSPPDSAFTRALLEPAGIVCPPIDVLVKRYLEHCVEVGFLRPPTGAAEGVDGAQAVDAR
ncbi:beta-ketoacyl synthase N-terminal-like domain-containing protein, partial [Dactylosporangium sp. NPDC005572]|uniref:beta-ketoacyl synthase N-terminal-like domain-containing protein n=1 Tax=Dactylosporangium sp. NPDC005572 TaxID=3156889 RepID=UPI0033B159BD